MNSRENQLKAFDRLLTVRDFACGTGQGTYELAACLVELSLDFKIEGLTLEKIDVWMAKEKMTPHLDEQSYFYPIIEKQNCLEFHVVDILNDSIREAVDLIIINGLIAGPVIQTDDAFIKIWNRLNSELKAGGIGLISDKFHDGFNKQSERFIKLIPKTLDCRKIENLLLVEKKIVCD